MSMLSNNSAAYSVRCGSVQQDFNQLCDDLQGQNFWKTLVPNENVFHTEKAGQNSSSESQQICAASDKQPPLPLRQRQQPLRHRKMSVPTPSKSDILKLNLPPRPKQQQALSRTSQCSSSDLLMMVPDESGHQLPLLPPRKAPSVPSVSLSVSPQSRVPPLPPKPKLNEHSLQTRPLPKPSDENDLPQPMKSSLPLKLRQISIPPPLPPKPNDEYLEPQIKAKPTHDNDETVVLKPVQQLKHSQDSIPPALPPRPTNQTIQPLIAQTFSIENLPPSPPLPLCNQPQQQPRPQTPSTPSTTGSCPSYDEPTSPLIPLMQPVRLPYMHSVSVSSTFSHRRPHFLLKRGSLITISVISFFLSLVSVSLLVLIMINPFSYSWQTRKLKTEEFKSCIKCVYLMQSTTDDNMHLKNLNNEERDGEIWCCAQSSEQISNLLMLVLKQQDYKPSPQTAVLQDVTPYAHRKLINDSASSKAAPEGHLIIKIGEEKPGLSSHFNNLSVSIYNNTLEIHVSGWYYIYSNIFYRTDCDKTMKFKTLEHNINLISKRDSVRGGSLVRAFYTCCSNCHPKDRKSSFTGGVFELLQGDQIFTSITDMRAVNFYEETPYLGVVMIGG